MGGQHAHTPVPESRRVRAIGLAVMFPLALVTVVALVLLWPGGIERNLPDQPRELPATVVEVVSAPCAGAGAGAGGGVDLPGDENFAEPEQTSEEEFDHECGSATIEFDRSEAEPSGAEVPEQAEVLLPSGPGAPTISVGDRVDVMEMQAVEGESTWSIIDHQRTTGLWVLGLAFALAVIAFGRWRGVRSLIGLAVTFAVLVFFFVPAVLAGTSPVVAALVTCAAVVLVVLHLTHGTGLVATVAVLGTLASLAVTCLLAWAAVALLHLSGVTDDLSTAISMNHGIDAQGLLLAGIMIGSLGVLDDVTVTQSATVHEIAQANPEYRVGDLYAAGSRVGRAHIASVINTIVLAYAGSSLPLFILILANNDSFGGVLTDQLVAQEVVRSAVATLGLIAAVPLTTLLAAWAARGVRDVAGRRAAHH